jgi:two-component system phosphate regulon response regulator OmpR
MEHRKKRILVIEDDAEMRSLLKDFVKEEGFDVDSVEDGSEAFRKLAKENFDLIISDLRMPGLGGLEILPGLKKIQPGVPVILITAFGSEEVHRRALERGADAYLEKPIHFDGLKALIQEVVSSKDQNKKV